MTSEQRIRRNAAGLARDVRRIELAGDWTRREWNNQVRIAIRQYISNTRKFLRANT